MAGMIVSVLDQVDTICKDFVFAGYDALVRAYGPAIFGLASLTLATLGYGTAMGYINTPLPELIKRGMQAGFILTFALVNHYFADFIYNLTTIAPNQIANNIIHALPHAAITDAHSAGEAMQNAFYEGMRIGHEITHHGSWHNIGPAIWGTIILLVVILIAIVGLLELIVAKFGLALLLVLSPLAVSMLFFPSTRSALFDGWLRHVISFALTPLFVLCAMVLVLMMMNSALGDITTALADDRMTITVFVPYILYGCIGIGLLYRAAALASSLSGGMATGMAHHINNGVKQAAKKFKRKDKDAETASKRKTPSTDNEESNKTTDAASKASNKPATENSRSAT